MYECEAENQFRVSKAFINIDGKYSSSLIEGKHAYIFLFILTETILFNSTTTTTRQTITLTPKYHRTLSSSQSYGRFR